MHEPTKVKTICNLRAMHVTSFNNQKDPIVVLSKASCGSEADGAMHVVQFAMVWHGFGFFSSPLCFLSLLKIRAVNQISKLTSHLFFFSIVIILLLIGFYLFFILFYNFFLSVLSYFYIVLFSFNIKYNTHSIDCCFFIFLICLIF